MTQALVAGDANLPGSDFGELLLTCGFLISFIVRIRRGTFPCFAAQRFLAASLVVLWGFWALAGAPDGVLDGGCGVGDGLHTEAVNVVARWMAMKLETSESLEVLISNGRQLDCWLSRTPLPSVFAGPISGAMTSPATSLLPVMQLPQEASTRVSGYAIP
jgi:hypothetical protein